MPIFFTHLLSGVATSSLLYTVFRGRNHLFFYLFTAGAFTFPDLDHLATWRPVMSSWIVPSAQVTLSTGLFGALGTHTGYPPFFLHIWALPMTGTLGAVMFLAAERENRVYARLEKYLYVGLLGWSVHLAMDGVTP